MQAVDIMTKDVISVGPEEEVSAIAQLLLNHHISAVPVIDDSHLVVGIVSEGDLMRRIRKEDGKESSWWLSLFAGHKDPADYVKTHGRKADEVMTVNPMTIEEDAPLHKIARLLEKHRIKRVPVVKEGKLVGIVSRANLLQGLATEAAASDGALKDDRAIRDAILDEIEDNTGVRSAAISVTVSNGVAELWGLIDSSDQRKAIEVAAENTPGVTRVENNLGYAPRGVGGY
ncbi:MAG: CBS domain-containing protein [Halomonas sp.]|nr:CBS domain-containing protein [Halomonas sp.]TVM07285.1 MAG: CBS domain-containing protein [Halomonas sp.]